MLETPYYRHSASPGRATTIRAAESAKNQVTPLVEPGLTIVAFVRAADQYQLRSACSRLQEARKSFRSFESAWHLTITSILAHDQPRDLTERQRREIEQIVANVIEEEASQWPQFAVALLGIEPGGQAERPSGNVVAVATPASRHLIELMGTRLREKLVAPLSAIHSGVQPQPPNGVKVTLGFFDESRDFRVDRDLVLALHERRRVETELWIERIALVRFQSKSLEDAFLIHEVQLPRPDGISIRRATFRPKVLVSPHWASWRGFSYLWNNPGDSLACRPDAEVAQIACEAWTDPELVLYRAFGDSLAECGLDSADNAFAFCPLPSTSYHVTAWDGINEENLSQITEPEREAFSDFLLGLPDSAKCAPRSLISPDAFEVIDHSTPVRLRFENLVIWGDTVLAARLAPSDDASARILKEVGDTRRGLDGRFAPTGRARSLDYAPHVSLGYFSHPGGGLAAAADLPQWQRIFRNRTNGKKLDLSSIGAYGFTSMAEFFKLHFA